MMAAHNTVDIPNLRFLLEGLDTSGNVKNVTINAIRIDSRKVTQGDLFIALEGYLTNGKDYINDAIVNGALAIILDSNNQALQTDSSIPVYTVPDLKSRLGLLASRFYGNPSENLHITGITGTNGKTSIAYYLAQALADLGDRSVGTIGTLGHGIFGKMKSQINTTPDVITINGLLNEFSLRQISDVVMEVSSHGLEQGRVDNINFDTAVFTNLSRDHLDYHGDITDYGEAKKKLFTNPGLKNAVINTDDLYGEKLAAELSGKTNVIRYGISERSNVSNNADTLVSATIKRQEINSLKLGIVSPWGTDDLTVFVSGQFNVYNLLACLGVLCTKGIPFKKAIKALSQVKGVPGRMEFFGTPSSAKIFVDYSHTPDALQQALATLRQHCKGKLVCVFGCGGDRDKGKRPEMGKVAEQYSDRIILTNDNPRTESPEKIIQDIMSGMSGAPTTEIQIDRTIAIREAIQSSSPDEIILIAGKGHETYQDINSVKLPFSDRQLVRNLLEARE